MFKGFLSLLVLTVFSPACIFCGGGESTNQQSIPVRCWDTQVNVVDNCNSKRSMTMSGWWFGTFGLFFHILGMSSSQLTFIFFRGVGIPPTRCCLPHLYRPPKQVGLLIRPYQPIFMTGEISQVHPPRDIDYPYPKSKPW